MDTILYTAIYIAGQLADRDEITSKQRDIQDILSNKISPCFYNPGLSNQHCSPAKVMYNWWRNYAN